jgi:hypothetical protein
MSALKVKKPQRRQTPRKVPQGAKVNNRSMRAGFSWCDKPWRHSIVVKAQAAAGMPKVKKAAAFERAYGTG